MDHVRIEKGEMVRIRIVGTRVDAKEIVSFF
jgi:DNA-directed RNA polymerase subunit E'/Rpb7